MFDDTGEYIQSSATVCVCEIPTCQVRVSPLLFSSSSSFSSSVFPPSSPFKFPPLPARRHINGSKPYRELRMHWATPGPEHMPGKMNARTDARIECWNRCQIECRNKCQIEGQKECRKECQIECQKECQIICQKECQIEYQPHRMPERMSDRSDRMSDYMPDRMSKYLCHDMPCVLSDKMMSETISE